MTNFLSNHDTSRAVSRWGDENIFWQEAAKTLAMMQFALKGVPAIYYGEEIGMLNPRFPGRTAFRDVDALNAYKLLVDEQKIYTNEEMTKYHNINSRDNCRTPMQWTSATNSGFNQGSKPWIKLGNNYQMINVAAQVQDPNSILNFYKHLIALRKNSKYKQILIFGSSQFKLLDNGVFKITRANNKMRIVTFLNLCRSTKTVALPNFKVLARSWTDNKKITNNLRAYESIMFFEAEETKNAK